MSTLSKVFAGLSFLTLLGAIYLALGVYNIYHKYGEQYAKAEKQIEDQQQQIHQLVHASEGETLGIRALSVRLHSLIHNRRGVWYGVNLAADPAGAKLLVNAELSKQGRVFNPFAVQSAAPAEATPAEPTEEGAEATPAAAPAAGGDSTAPGAPFPQGVVKGSDLHLFLESFDPAKGFRLAGYLGRVSVLDTKADTFEATVKLISADAELEKGFAGIAAGGRTMVTVVQSLPVDDHETLAGLSAAQIEQLAAGRADLKGFLEYAAKDGQETNGKNADDLVTAKLAKDATELNPAKGKEAVISPTGDDVLVTGAEFDYLVSKGMVEATPVKRTSSRPLTNFNIAMVNVENAIEAGKLSLRLQEGRLGQLKTASDGAKAEGEIRQKQAEELKHDLQQIESEISELNEYISRTQERIDQLNQQLGGRVNLDAAPIPNGV